MMTDFELKLKEQLNSDIDSTNIDVLANILCAKEEPKRSIFDFFRMQRRVLAGATAGLLVLFVGLYSGGLFGEKVNPADQPQMLMSVDNGMNHSRNATPQINVSIALQELLLESEMNDDVDVVVLSLVSESDFITLASLDRKLEYTDFEQYATNSEVELSLKIDKASIINMQEFFYFMLPSEK